MKERLQKVMAEAGVASRRQCEQLVLDEFVRVLKPGGYGLLVEGDMR